MTGLDGDDVAEVDQRVWVELHRSMLRIRDPKSLPKWLIVTARRIAYRQAIVSRRWVDEVRDDITDPKPGPDSIVEDLEARWQLEEALDRIGTRCRDLLVHVFFRAEKASYRELATYLDVKEDSVGAMKTRCLRALRKILEEQL